MGSKSVLLGLTEPGVDNRVERGQEAGAGGNPEFAVETYFCRKLQE